MKSKTKAIILLMLASLFLCLALSSYPILKLFISNDNEAFNLGVIFLPFGFMLAVWFAIWGATTLNK